MTTTGRRPSTKADALQPLRRRSVLAPRVLLWSVIAVAAVAGLTAWLRPSPNPVAAADASTPPEVATVAERAVCQWADRIGNSDPDRAATSAPVTPPGCSAILTRRQDPTAWQVLIAVDLPAGLGGTPHAVTWFVAIRVARTSEGTVVAVGDPAVVPAPSEPRRATASAGTSLSMEDPLARTVAGFASALLTGVADAARYAAPDVALSAVSPPPFRSVTVTRIAVHRRSTREALVDAAVVATTPSGATVPLAYEFTVVARDDRWEISHVTAARSTFGPDDAASTTTTSAPTAPSTATTTLVGD